MLGIEERFRSAAVSGCVQCPARVRCILVSGRSECAEDTLANALANETDRAIGHQEVRPSSRARSAEPIRGAVDAFRRVAPVYGVSPRSKVDIHLAHKDCVRQAICNVFELHCTVPKQNAGVSRVVAQPESLAVLKL